MNPTSDPVYNRVAQRVAGLTPVQWRNVQQRVRSVRARMAASVYLMALDSAIDLELSGRTPCPKPCPAYLITGRLPQAICLERPLGPFRQNPPDVGSFTG